MCGRCRTVFNAFETLKRVEDELPVMPTPYFPTSVPASAANSSATPAISSAYAQTMSPIGVAPSYSVSGGEVNAPLTNTGLRDDSTGRFTPLLDTMLAEDAAENLAETQAEAVHVHAPSPSPSPLAATSSLDILPSAPAGFTPADDIDAAIEMRADSNASIDIKSSRREPTISPRDLRQLSTAQSTNARLDSSFESPLESPLEFNADPLSGPPLMATDPTDTEGSLTYPREPAASPSRRWLVLSGAMLLVLGAQSVFYFRHSLSQTYLQLRPALTSGCELLGCRLSWARESAAIEVKGSELVELPSKPGRMLASATLINRGKVTQDYPAIELRLTNNTNQTVMSRVLLPSDYLNAATVKDQGMIPNAEVALSLNIEVPPKTAASGYEFLPFYP